MEDKDVAATVLASLSLFVSVIAACLTVFCWWYQEKIRKRQRVADVKKRYASDGVPFSVLQVAELWKHHKATEPSATHGIWDVLYRKRAEIETEGGDMLQRRELWQHMNKADSYWDEVVDQHSKGDLPGFFHSDGGWLARADNYRRLFEPLFIANYYQMESTSYLAVAAADGTPLKRPKRYWYIEELWSDMEPGKPLYNTKAWAEEYERLRSTHQEITMRRPPEELQHRDGVACKQVEEA